MGFCKNNIICGHLAKNNWALLIGGGYSYHCSTHAPRFPEYNTRQYKYLVRGVSSHPTVIVGHGQVTKAVSVTLVSGSFEVNSASTEVMTHVDFVKTQSVKGGWKILQVKKKDEMILRIRDWKFLRLIKSDRFYVT